MATSSATTTCTRDGRGMVSPVPSSSQDRPDSGPGQMYYWSVRRLKQHVPRLKVRPDLALDPLQRVVDGLRVAREPLGDRLVGVAVEVERQDGALELRQDARQARDEAVQLPARDPLVHRVVRHRARKHLVERRLGVTRRRRRRRERDVLVERGVLVAGRGLHRRDDLARDAELREVAEGRLAIGAVVTDGLVEADETFLDEIVPVAANEEVAGGLQ